MILKSKKDSREELQEQGIEEEESLDKVIHLQDRSPNLKAGVLKIAVEKLKTNFKSLPKSLFKTGFPSPVIRSRYSRPLHFTEDGRHLIYFSKTELIKVDLTTSTITLRRKLPRADISPIFYDHKIWSRDSNRVLVLSSLKLNPEESEFGIAYVYDIKKNKYIELPKVPGGFSIECFNPASSDELIVKADKDCCIKTWNFITNRKRTIENSNFLITYKHVVRQSDYLIVIHRAPRKQSEGRGWYIPKENSVEIYSAKGLKRLLRFEFKDIYNPKERYDVLGICSDYFGHRQQALSIFSEEKIGKVSG